MPINEPIPSEVWGRIYYETGSFILNWAIFESCLEKWIALLHRKALRNSKDSKLPKELSRKTKYLREAFKELDSLQPFHDEAVSCLDRSAPLSTLRHTLIHGAISAYRFEDRALLFVRLIIDRSDDIHMASEEWIGLDQLAQASESCLALTRDALALGNRMADQII